MSDFKKYAKEAKERMKNGFWERAKQTIEQEKQVAATLGVSQNVAVMEQKRKLLGQIYNSTAFSEEEDFYGKVVEILESDQTVLNPIMRLADKQKMQSMTASERESYISRLAMRYREAVDRYNRLHS